MDDRADGGMQNKTIRNEDCSLWRDGRDMLISCIPNTVHHTVSDSVDSPIITTTNEIIKTKKQWPWMPR
jgi:hypothetical protein